MAVVRVFAVLVSLASATVENAFSGRPSQGRVFVYSEGTFYVDEQPLNQTRMILEVTSDSGVSDLVGIAVTSGEIGRIGPGTFQNFPKLEHLNLSGNLLEEIRDGDFNELPLRVLDLSNNRIAKLARNALSDMPLRFLFLDNNRISRWNRHWFVGTPLEVLSFSNNLLQSLPSNALRFAVKLQKNSSYALMRLILSDNRLKRIDSNAFKSVSHLGFVSLKNNSLKRLPADVFSSVHISTLVLSHNRIAKVEAFKNVNIDHLDLRNNDLNCLDSDLFEKSRIYYIYITGNPLDCVCVEKWKEWRKSYYMKITSWDDVEKNCVKTVQRRLQ